MNLTKALKQKNKLVKKSNDAWSKLSAYNSIESGTERAYSAREAYYDWIKYSDELVSLKAKIQAANVPIYSKIFELSELKNQVSRLKSLSCRSGKSNVRYSDDVLVYESDITVVERDNMVANLEDRIESIQEQIESHNALTTI
jgi:predicted  nucleic acid-binding Zn-ribbon protein